MRTETAMTCRAMLDTRMIVCVPTQSDVRRLRNLTAGIRIEALTEILQSDALLQAVEFLVPPYYEVELRDQLPLLIRRMSALKVIHSLTTGVDWLLETVPPSVILCRIHDIYSAPVSRWVLESILVMEEQSELPHRLRSLSDQLVVIVGYGSVGRAVERRLQPLGAKIVRIARRARRGVMSSEHIVEFLPKADIVVLTLPLTSSTAGMVDAVFLASMKHNALLVNAARGAIVQTTALVGAIRERHIRAALDVTDPEPLPANHALLSEPGVLLTSHLAGGSRGHFPSQVYQVVAEQLGRIANNVDLLYKVTGGY